MYKVALVEDEWESAENLEKCFERYTKEYGVPFSIVHFKSGLNFLDGYSPDFDMVFMDIDMPQMNGLKTAKELRRIDSRVVLVFVTFLAKYAIKGYEVDALDYCLKPVNYNAFKMKIDRAIAGCAKRGNVELVLPLTGGGALRLEPNQLDYVEISDHDIIYHTSHGIHKYYGNLRVVEKLLPETDFFKCNRCYLVNLRSVTRIEGNYAYVGEDKLAVSRSRRQAFVDALHEYTLANNRLVISRGQGIE